MFTVTVSLGSSNKYQAIQRGMEKKSRKCSDHGKEAELSFSFSQPRSSSLGKVDLLLDSCLPSLPYENMYLMNYDILSQTLAGKELTKLILLKLIPNK